MSIAALIRRMAETGASAEAIALAVEAIEAGQAALEEKRAKVRERVRRHRALRYGNVTVTLPVTPCNVTPPSPERPSEPCSVTVEDNQNPTPPIVPPAQKRAGPARASEAFECFWKSYPKREGSNPKQPASKSFHRAVAAGADPEAIVAGAKRYAAKQLGKDARFVAQAQTWLNQRRWEDEAAEATTEVVAIHGAYVLRETPQWEAWDAHYRQTKGRSPPCDARGGWHFPAEWPPPTSATA